MLNRNRCAGTLCLCDESNGLQSPAMGHWGCFREAWVEPVGSFVFSAHGGPSDVVSDVSIDAGPIDFLSCLCLHLLHPLLCTLEVSKGTVEEFCEDTDSTSLQKNASLNGNSSWVPHKCQAILRTCLRRSGHPLRVNWYRVLYTRSHSMAPQMTSNLSVDIWTCWIFWWVGIGRDSLREGK